MPTQRPVLSLPASFRGKFLSIVLLLAVGACQTNTEADSASAPNANTASRESLVETAQARCLKDLSSASSQGLSKKLSRYDISFADFCGCYAQSLFGSITPAEAEQISSGFMERELWKSRAEGATAGCVAPKMAYESCLKDHEAEASTMGGWRLEMYSRHGMTVDDYCECYAQAYFGNRTDSEMKQYLESGAAQEPWRTYKSDAVEQCTPEPLYSGREWVELITRHPDKWCTRSVESDAPLQEEEVCYCHIKLFFGTLSHDESIALGRDYRRYHNFMDHEPWKSRGARVAKQCSARKWPS